MKKRINISIEYSILCAVKEKGDIKNLSAFIETCLYNHLQGETNFRKTENIGNNTQYTEEQLKEMIDISNYDWRKD